MAEQVKLHLGCSKNILKGWINVDYVNGPGVDLVWDLLRGIPFAGNSIDFIFTEHLLEHFTLEEGQVLLDECHRVLKPKGVIRIVVPAIEIAIHLYQTGKWEEEHWIEKNNITTDAEFINAYFRSWGHQFIYNEAQMILSLRQSRFCRIEGCYYQQSSYPELCNLEVHNDLIVEGVK